MPVPNDPMSAVFLLVMLVGVGSVLPPILLTRCVNRRYVWTTTVTLCNQVLWLGGAHWLWPSDPTPISVARLTSVLTSAAFMGLFLTRPRQEPVSRSSSPVSDSRALGSATFFEFSGWVCGMVCLLSVAAGLAGPVVGIAALLIDGRTIQTAGLDSTRWEWLGVVATLVVATFAGLVATGRRGYVTVLFWLVVVGVAVFATRSPGLEYTTGDHSIHLVLTPVIIGWGVTMLLFVTGLKLHRQQSRWRAAHFDPDSLPLAMVDPRGIRISAGILGIVLILLIFLHVLAPAVSTMEHVAVALGALAAGAACFALADQRWSINHADVAMGLVTGAFCVLSVTFVPESASLAQRYPMVFNVLLISLAASSALWIWLAKVWRQQLDGDKPWTTAGHLVPQCEGFAFYSSCMAVVLATLMTVWPRMKSVVTMDHSLGRTAAAIAGHLVVLGVLVWGRRQMKRPGTALLIVWTVLSLVGFIALRAEPFTDSVASNP